MPSDALLAWQAVRLPRLQNIEADCVVLDVLHTANPNRVQEFIRSYAVLLSAEFQGFCRDLHDECAEQLVRLIAPVPLQAVLRSQCRYGRKLDTGNANPRNLSADFNRYEFELWATLLAVDPGIAARRDQLDMLNTWRNAIAHHNYDPAKLGGTTSLTVAQVRDWRTDCDALAIAFDQVIRNHLQATTGVLPWPP